MKKFADRFVMPSKVRLITAKTLDQHQLIADILRESAEWMIQNSVPNWKPSQFDPAQMQKDPSGVYHLAMRDGQAVGTALLMSQDDFFWPGIPAGDTIFVHKLAVRRRLAGQNVGYAILDAVCALARRHGKSWVRLDCRGDRPKLRQYYERYGFQLVDEPALFPDYFTARYQFPTVRRD